MKEEQWDILVRTVNGERFDSIPIAFIIDSPWLPGWAGETTLDYFSSDNIWFEANLQAVNTFPEVIFLPGYWSEYGMCTEPSAFGAKTVWSQNDPPYAGKVLKKYEDIKELEKPDVNKDGLLPFVLNRLRINEERIKNEGDYIRFAVSRGPLNIASYLLGVNELLLGIKTNPEEVKMLIAKVSDFIVDWLEAQYKCFSTIDGIFLLDDIIGFIGEQDFREFALPYLQKIYSVFPASIRFLHNDAAGLITAKYLNDIGVNIYNFSFNHSFQEIRELAGDSVTLLGNIPPRDVLAKGSEEEISNCVKNTISTLQDSRRIVLSCGGGMPQSVTTEQIRSFISSVKEFS